MTMYAMIEPNSIAYNINVKLIFKIRNLNNYSFFNEN